jgi:hypothetical protein
MSLSTIYCCGTDDRLYANPMIFSDDWYITVDDKEPPELVMAAELFRRMQPAELFAKYGVKATVTSRNPCGDRLFPPNYKLFKKAVSFFVKFEGDKFPIVQGVGVQHDGAYASVNDLRDGIKIEKPRKR